MTDDRGRSGHEPGSEGDAGDRPFADALERLAGPTALGDSPGDALGDPPAGTLDEALEGRTDVDELGSDPDVRFPGETEDPQVFSTEGEDGAH